LRQSPGDISAVFIDFGQASARRERAAATEVASLLGMDLSVVEVKSGTAFGPGEIIGRNAFLAFTALLTGNLRSGVIALGIHSGTPYYDCSELFVKRLDTLIRENTNGRVSLQIPFLGWSKAEVYTYFSTIGIPANITYSCQAGSWPPCGKCPSCLDRKELRL
jgi:7-cyano-7-deazaguanine synthase